MDAEEFGEAVEAMAQAVVDMAQALVESGDVQDGAECGALLMSVSKMLAQIGGQMMGDEAHAVCPVCGVPT